MQKFRGSRHAGLAVKGIRTNSSKRLSQIIIYRVDHKVGQFFFFKESNFQIVGVFCATKIFFLIFDTFKKKTDQHGPPYRLLDFSRECL
jgi:predicted NAD-dependent protein-ADP-ribosyltransferase YbiA (DUF1768 family)